MTSLGKTNWGTTLALGDGGTPEIFTTIGEIVSLDPPELTNDSIEATNHSSNHNREFIASMLIDLSEFKLTVNYVSADLAVQILAVQVGSESNYRIRFANADVWEFAAIIKAVKPLPADAQSPEVLRAEITVRPTGASNINAPTASLSPSVSASKSPSRSPSVSPSVSPSA